MIRKYYNHTPQTNTQHREEQLQNTDCVQDIRKTVKQSNTLSLSYQDDCKARRTQSTK